MPTKYAVAERDLSHTYYTGEDLEGARLIRSLQRELHPERHPVIFSQEEGSVDWKGQYYQHEQTFTIEV